MVGFLEVMWEILMKAETENNSELYIPTAILHNLKKLKKKKFRYMKVTKMKKHKKKLRING